MTRRFIPDETTIGLWRMDSAAGGLVNLANPGTRDMVNDGTTSVAVTGMPFANARNFDGSSTYTHVVWDSGLRYPTEFTVFAFVKPETAWDTNGGCFVAGYFAEGFRLYQYTGIGGPYVEFNATENGGSNRPARILKTLAFDEWAFVAGVMKIGQKNKLYLGDSDGFQVAECPTTQSTYQMISNIEWGKSYTTYWLDGQIAESGLIHRALTPWEIYNTYRGIETVAVGLK